MKPYVILSDLHLHDWSTFSTINENGVNSRLQIIIDEVTRAKDTLLENGGDTMILAGDIFHTRGKLSPEVINPVVSLFTNLCKEISVYGIPGNHDLASDDSQWLTSAASVLGACGVTMLNDSGIVNDIVMIPWHKDISELKIELEKMSSAVGRATHDVVIHAPVDGVIDGIPSHGLNDEYLADLGYKRVFSGHYHNHVDFHNGVYSIGATTHQTWSDVGAKAGFLLVTDRSVRRFASHAPSFVDIYSDMTEEELLDCDGNYVRAKIGKATPEDISEVRADLLKRGAAGVVIQAIKTSEISSREGIEVGESVSLSVSVNSYIESVLESDNPKDLAILCDNILNEVEEV